MIATVCMLKGACENSLKARSLNNVQLVLESKNAPREYKKIALALKAKPKIDIVYLAICVH
jgi:hypothetical protein